jgi:hypothetical protein
MIADRVVLSRQQFDLPTEVEAVFRAFWTCELSTLARDGTPITWPILPIYRPRVGQFVIFTPIGVPQKAINIRRNPKVSLLFSEPKGSGLAAPPAVLVQGTAEAPDELFTLAAWRESEYREDVFAQARKALKNQPMLPMILSNPVTNYLMDWYLMRLVIVVTPGRIMWWERGDFTRAPREMEPAHVA